MIVIRSRKNIMPFESRARRFLKDQGKLSKPKPRCEINGCHQIQFLLDNNAIGHKNLIRTDDIVEHIQKIKPKLPEVNGKLIY